MHHSIEIISKCSTISPSGPKNQMESFWIQQPENLAVRARSVYGAEIVHLQNNEKIRLENQKLFLSRLDLAIEGYPTIDDPVARPTLALANALAGVHSAGIDPETIRKIQKHFFTDNEILAIEEIAENLGSSIDADQRCSNPFTSAFEDEAIDKYASSLGYARLAVERHPAAPGGQAAKSSMAAKPLRR